MKIKIKKKKKKKSHEKQKGRWSLDRRKKAVILISENIVPVKSRIEALHVTKYCKLDQARIEIISR